MDTPILILSKPVCKGAGNTGPPACLCTLLLPPVCLDQQHGDYSALAGSVEGPDGQPAILKD